MPDQTTPRCGQMSRHGRCILTAGHDSSIDHLYPTPATPLPIPADLTVYEMRVGPDDDPRPEVVSTYATMQAAAAHGEHAYQLKHGLAGTLEWPFTGTDDAPRWRLEAVDDLDGDETLTDWHIVAVTIPATYGFSGGEQR